MVKIISFIITICLLVSATLVEAGVLQRSIRVRLEASDIACLSNFPLWEYKDVSAVSGTVSREVEITAPYPAFASHAWANASASDNGILKAETLAFGFNYGYWCDDSIGATAYAESQWSHEYRNEEAAAQTFKLDFTIYGGRFELYCPFGCAANYGDYMEVAVRTDILVNGIPIKVYYAFLSAELQNEWIFSFTESPFSNFGGSLNMIDPTSLPYRTSPFFLDYNWDQFSDEVTLGTFQPGEFFTVTYRMHVGCHGNMDWLYAGEGDDQMGYSCAVFENPFDESAITYESVTVVSPDEDQDNDGIHNNVDTQPTTFSQDFSDVGIGGTTTGTITDRGDQILTVTEETNPSGVRISADPSGGSIPATISICGGSSIISIDAGEETVVTCSSVTIEVIRGTVDIVFIADNGTSANASLSAGNNLTFEPIAGTITAPLSNADDVIVLINEVEVFITPGETINISDTDGDGVLDYEDECLDSNIEETVIIDGCDSGVENNIFEDGCSMSDLIAECAEDARNHGKFVSCVSHLTNDWKKKGLIRGKEKGAIQSCAAQANIP